MSLVSGAELLSNSVGDAYDWVNCLKITIENSHFMELERHSKEKEKVIPP